MKPVFSILALDFHNTIYDEVMEYGLAIDAGIATWVETAAQQGRKLDRAALHGELSKAHRELGSDWDDDAWRLLPALKSLGLDTAGFDKALTLAIQARREKSRQLTTSGVFSGAVGTLKSLKRKGVRLYVISEAAADAGMMGLGWLGLGGTIDGVYSYPSRRPPAPLKNTCHTVFPAKPGQPGQHLKKPNPALLAAVALDDAKRMNKIPRHILPEEVFEVAREERYVLQEFPSASPLQEDTAARLVLKTGRHEEALRQTLAAMLYVGDSKFKDGLLARNAGVKFGFAAYGKKIRSGEEALYARSREILYEVTGWDKDVLKLTQEAAQAEAVRSLRPDFTFQETLAEALPLF